MHRWVVSKVGLKTQQSNKLTFARRLLRRPYLGRDAVGELPSCGPRYCCVGEKGKGRARTGRERGITTEEHNKKQNSPSTTGSGTRTLANGPSAADNPEVLPLNLPENGAGKDGV